MIGPGHGVVTDTGGNGDILGVVKREFLLPYALARGGPHGAGRPFAGDRVLPFEGNFGAGLPWRLLMLLGAQVDELVVLNELSLPHIDVVVLGPELEVLLPQERRSAVRQQEHLSMNTVATGDRPNEFVTSVLDRDTPLTAGFFLGGIESPDLLIAIEPGLGPRRSRRRPQTRGLSIPAAQPPVGRSPSGNREDQHDDDRHDDGSAPPARGGPAVGSGRVGRTCLVRRRRPCRAVGGLGRLLHDRLSGESTRPGGILPPRPCLEAAGSREGLRGLRTVGRLRTGSTVREGPRGVARPLGSIRHIGEYSTELTCAAGSSSAWPLPPAGNQGPVIRMLGRPSAHRRLRRR